MLCVSASTAPFLFTRVFQPVSAWAHRRGIRLTRYLDDWLITATDQQTVAAHTDQIVRLCQRVGLIINFKKSDLAPSQRVTYLGMDIDTQSFLTRPTADRIQRLNGVLRSFSIGVPVAAVVFLRLLGHMVSLEKIVPGARLRLRSIQFHLKDHWSSEQDLSTLVPVVSALQPDLLWWSDPVNLLRGHPIHELEPDFLLFSDASRLGWGAHLGESQVSGLWSAADLRHHINWLELRAVWLGLRHFHQTVAGSTVLAMTDNTTVVGYIKNQGGDTIKGAKRLDSKNLGVGGIPGCQSSGPTHPGLHEHHRRRPFEEGSGFHELVSEPPGLQSPVASLGSASLGPVRHVPEQ